MSACSGAGNCARGPGEASSTTCPCRPRTRASSACRWGRTDAVEADALGVEVHGRLHRPDDQRFLRVRVPCPGSRPGAPRSTAFASAKSVVSTSGIFDRLQVQEVAAAGRRRDAQTAPLFVMCGATRDGEVAGGDEVDQHRVDVGERRPGQAGGVEQRVDPAHRCSRLRWRVGVGLAQVDDLVAATSTGAAPSGRGRGSRPRARRGRRPRPRPCPPRHRRSRRLACLRSSRGWPSMLLCSKCRSEPAAGENPPRRWGRVASFQARAARAGPAGSVSPSGPERTEDLLVDAVDPGAVQGEPPSTTRFCPVTKRARSEQRKTTTSAMSAGRPSRTDRGGSFEALDLVGQEGHHGSVMAVRIMPGDTALTRISGPYSSAAERSGQPPRLGRGIGRLAGGRTRAADRGRGYDAAAPGTPDVGIAARNPRYTPVRFTRTSRSHSSGAHS